MAFTAVPTVTDGDTLVDDWGNAVSAKTDELGAIASGGSTGADNAGPTSGTTELTVKTLTVPVPAVPGRVHAWASLNAFSKSVASDIFSVNLYIDGNLVNSARTNNQATGADSVAPTGSAAVDNVGTVAVAVTVQRISGTGTLTTGGGSNVVLHWIFIPAP